MARGAIGRGPVHRKKKHTGPTAVRRSPTEGAPDGRHRRSEATRRRLFDAMLALMHELNDIPTTAAVTKRAGVGLRTLFQHFPDATAFYAAFFDHVIMTTLSTMPPVSPEGPLEERIAGFVERRSRVCELWAPLWRIALRFAAHDQGFRDRISRVGQLLRARAQILYSPELAVLPSPAQTAMLDALMSLTEMDAWVHLREQCGRDVAGARSIWRFSIEALFARAPLLGGAPAAG
jgi:AcrR family transcriptional regulator